jgi:hypothetical protein
VTQSTSKPRFAHAGRPAQNQIFVRVDPLAIGELWEQSAEAAWGPVIDVLDAGLLAQSGIAQPGGKPLVAAMGELAVEQEAEPVGMSERGGFVGSFELGKRLGHAGQAKLANWSSMGWVSTAFSSVVVARSADIGVEDRHAIDGRPLRRLAIELVVEEGAHRAVGQRADLDRPRGGGFEAIGTERPHQPHDAEAGSEALFGMGPARQDQLA